MKWKENVYIQGNDEREGLKGGFVYSADCDRQNTEKESEVIVFLPSQKDWTRTQLDLAEEEEGL
jgi:hypothetical protein